MTRTAVVTIAHGRHEHLRAQQRGLARGDRLPDDHIIVAMADPEIARRTVFAELDGIVIDVPSAPGGLPLARARNAGAEAAIRRGAAVLVFLDVDCIPGRTLVSTYGDAGIDARFENALLSGPVTYLSQPPLAGYPIDDIETLDRPHSARPAPEPGQCIPAASPDLFWSLSFALSASAWQTIGGFAEEYVGYGGEDTDFARIAARRGIELVWLGSARAYHQWHPTQTPPVQHLDDIVRNSNLFFSRWGVWPMSGWLEEFRARGLITGGEGSTPCARTATSR